MEGVLEGCLLLEPVVNETFRFSETKTNRFLHRDSGRTRLLCGRLNGFSTPPEREKTSEPRYCRDETGFID